MKYVPVGPPICVGGFTIQKEYRMELVGARRGEPRTGPGAKPRFRVTKGGTTLVLNEAEMFDLEEVIGQQCDLIEEESGDRQGTAQAAEGVRSEG